MIGQRNRRKFMRITELFTAQSIALDEALQTQEQILSLVKKTQPAEAK